ncbi:unnamed protein product, partial [Amoebophrya sp. A120]
IALGDISTRRQKQWQPAPLCSCRTDGRPFPEFCKRQSIGRSQCSTHSVDPVARVLTLSDQTARADLLRDLEGPESPSPRADTSPPTIEGRRVGPRCRVAARRQVMRCRAFPETESAAACNPGKYVRTAVAKRL